MIRRVLKLLLEWYLFQQLKETITESKPFWVAVFVLLTEFLIQHQLKPALARVDCTNLPKFATKPMFGFLVPFFLGASLLVLFIPFYLMLITVFIAGWDGEFVFNHFEKLSPVIGIGSPIVILAFLARLRMPQMEQWADSVWGISSQRDIDFYNRQLFALKVGVVFSIAFSIMLLMFVGFYG